MCYEQKTNTEKQTTVRRSLPLFGVAWGVLRPCIQADRLDACRRPWQNDCLGNLSDLVRAILSACWCDVARPSTVSLVCVIA